MEALVTTRVCPQASFSSIAIAQTIQRLLRERQGNLLNSAVVPDTALGASALAAFETVSAEPSGSATSNVTALSSAESAFSGPAMSSHGSKQEAASEEDVLMAAASAERHPGSSLTSELLH